MNNQHASRATSVPEFAVETDALAKTYRGKGGAPGVHALRAVDIKIRRGCVFGLLGPNGAGKSTLINILAGLVVKSSGTARIWGYDIAREPRRARAAIGVVPQEIYFDTFFTPREIVEMQAGFYGVPKSERRTDELLAIMGLTDKADDYSRTLSGGMKRRLLVAKALAHNPPVVVLDEPTAGVDIELRHHLWTYLRELNARGTTILLTTHYLEEAEDLCDEIAIIDHGEVVACDTTPALVARLDRKELAVTLVEKLDAVPPALAPFSPRLVSPHRLAFLYKPSQQSAADILGALSAAGLTIADLTTTEADLEAIFLKLTREDGGDGETGDAQAKTADPQAGTIALTRTRPQP